MEEFNVRSCAEKIVAMGYQPIPGRANVFNVVSHNQSGGITAGQVLIGRPPRQLDEPAREHLRRELPAGSNVQVERRFFAGDDESYRLADQIEEFLRASGYQVTGGMSDHSHVNVHISRNAEGTQYFVKVGPQG